MGDRATFGFRDGYNPENTVYLYGHWAGHNMMARLARAVVRVKEAGRLGDSFYATRIAISDMVDDHDSDLGWGIGVVVPDSEHSVPVVTFGQTPKVELYGYSWAYGIEDEPKVTFTIDGFISKFSKEEVYS